MPDELTANQKIVVLKCCLILHNNEPFFNWIVVCDKKWIVILKKRNKNDK